MQSVLSVPVVVVCVSVSLNSLNHTHLQLKSELEMAMNEHVKQAESFQAECKGSLPFQDFETE
jgi:hypothetical protein